MLYDSERVYEGKPVVMQDFGKEIVSMGRGMRDSPTNVFMRACMSTENLKESVDIAGPTANSMKDNGLTGSSMVQGYGKEQREILTRDSGNSVKLTDMECITG